LRKWRPKLQPERTPGHDRRGSSIAGTTRVSFAAAGPPDARIARPPLARRLAKICKRHPSKAREMIERVAHQFGVAAERGKDVA